MCVDRREFLRLSAGVAGASVLAGDDAQAAPVVKAYQQLRPLPGKAVPITDDERRARIEKAQRLMAENKIDAIYLESGSSLFYYTGVRWGNSERMFAAVIPAKGELAWITPKFEEERARELIRFGKDIRAWEEDESPYKVVAGIFKDRGIRTGRIGMEERVRFFLFDGIRQEAKHLDYVSADPVTAGCRMIKSPAEIALLQRANDITLAAFKAAAATLKEGMTQYDFGAGVRTAFSALGSSGSALIGFGQYTAFPHGSIQPQKLKEGDVVLMDGGCSVEGYASDITRTFVFGKPSARQREIWNLERKAQDAAFAAAKPGATCESVDAAARKVITDAGFGPDYKVPGLPHRTGHGIGLDGHEWTNFVRGNKTKLQPGMCFSDEPMIAIYGEFGIRLEDCLYITEQGPKMFTAQSPSIDQPFG
ncbi:MAG TPA: Xaa-Pro peptidase family protein [Blastocatellia bacterium]|nr:Xaa-Pro peptidase family protein [Blastocatellia bacterium]HMV85156.1 Xaa-Pro peptidase family protein [Blastocatellia bacterium]HMX29148.1 Xaa-Pro peptidase family protein [Blastocatellia bacterium]HMY73022.1 Xaa-Pro peptidase family protein [Blastocatellia bacterium]HNG34869.1 Xaa-Pro peptidase family protein [Blastocatellia bacterium]